MDVGVGSPFATSLTDGSPEPRGCPAPAQPRLPAGTPPLLVETPSSLPRSWENPKLCGRARVSSVEICIFRVWDGARMVGDRICGDNATARAG